MDFLASHHEDESLNLVRYIAKEAKGESTVVYIFPINLQKQITLQNLRSVLYELEEKDYIEILQKPNHDLNYEQRLQREDEEDYYFIDVKQTFYDYAKARELSADSYNVANRSGDTQKSDKGIEAKLDFTSITIPIVTVGMTTYKLPNMRDGLPLNIISYCLLNRPNKTMEIGDLKNEMKAKGISTAGMGNLREILRKSLFGDNMPLSAFVVVSPGAILVKPQTTLTMKQLNAIEALDSSS